MPVAPGDLAAALTHVETYLAAHELALVMFRRQLHSNPELAGQEVMTTEAIEERLRAAGLDPVRLRSGTGLVCDVGAGPGGTGSGGNGSGGDRSGPTVALRADIDALAMPDGTDTAYRSRVEGVAHACGHDVHTAVVLGAGLALHRSGLLEGRVRLVFEPSEESVPGGAVQVVDEGWFEDVDVVFGLHCDPKLDVGKLAVRAGALTSATDLIELRVHGPGGHTARPELTVDLVALLARLASELPGRVAAAAPGDVRVVFGAVHAGDAANVVPAVGELRGTLRTPDPQVWEQARILVEDAARAMLEGTGADWEVRHRAGVPPVVNDADATGLLAACAREALGAEAVVAAEHSWGGDSFAWYTEQVPGAYARLGVHDPRAGGPRLDLHASTFDVDERAIGHGVRVLATTALAYLSNPESSVVRHRDGRA